MLFPSMVVETHLEDIVLVMLQWTCTVLFLKVVRTSFTAYASCYFCEASYYCMLYHMLSYPTSTSLALIATNVVWLTFYLNDKKCHPLLGNAGHIAEQGPCCLKDLGYFEEAHRPWFLICKSPDIMSQINMCMYGHVQHFIYGCMFSCHCWRILEATGCCYLLIVNCDVFMFMSR